MNSLHKNYIFNEKTSFFCTETENLKLLPTFRPPQETSSRFVCTRTVFFFDKKKH